MKRFFMTALLLLFGMLIFASCEDAEAPSETGGNTGSDIGTAEDMLILGEGADFVLVRPENSSEAEKEEFLRLVGVIGEACGYSPEIMTDWVNEKKGESIPEEAHEILVGATNRRASVDSYASLGKGEYSVSFDGTKVAISASDDMGLTMAVDYFIDKFITPGGGKVTMKSGFLQKNEYSITADMLLRSLGTLKEAEGADSGERGTLYMISPGALAPNSASNAADYDMLKFAVSLQGLENREDCSVFISEDKATRWLTYFRATEDGLLYGKKLVGIGSFDELVSALGDRIEAYGIVVWDINAPYTSNIATTVCGADGYLPVMYSEDEGSLYKRLLEKFGEGIVKLDLRGKFTGEAETKIWDTDIPSTGSAKCDAYLWAVEKYLKTDKASREYIAYMTDAFPVSPLGGGSYLDNSAYESYLPSQDFIVGNAIFTFDLSILSDEIPNDDPTQPVGTDYNTMLKIAEIQYERNNGEFSRCIGFPPFPYKYAGTEGGKNDPTMTEWLTIEIMSAHNIAVEADCPGPSSLYNASVYSKYESKLDYDQSAKRKAALDSLPEYEDDTYYLYIYMGDYDAASWTYHSGATFAWDSEDRGKLPLAWAFNPNLSERLPMIWDYFYATATENDYFIAGDSGAGYVNSVLLQEGKRKHSSLPDALDAWSRWNKKWYEKTDITITGMLLDGNNGYAPKKVLELVSAFSPDGIGVWNWPNGDSGTEVVNGVAVSGMAQDWNVGYRGNDRGEAAQALLKMINSNRPGGKLRFYPVKCNLNTPTDLIESIEAARALLDAEGKGRKLEVVDPYTFFAMIARELNK